MCNEWVVVTFDLNVTFSSIFALWTPSLILLEVPGLLHERLCSSTIVLFLCFYGVYRWDWLSLDAISILFWIKLFETAIFWGKWPETKKKHWKSFNFKSSLNKAGRKIKLNILLLNCFIVVYPSIWSTLKCKWKIYKWNQGNLKIKKIGWKIRIYFKNEIILI